MQSKYPNYYDENELQLIELELAEIIDNFPSAANIALGDDKVPEEIKNRIELLKIRREQLKLRLKDTGKQQAGDDEVITVEQAAALLNCSVKSLRNRISKAKRSGKELPWVLRAGRKKGCVVDRPKFLQWLRSRPKRRGRPPKSW